MADADWGELTAPLRRAAQALAGSNGLLQRLGSDRGFWAQLRALSELPAVVGFHPFADTQQWSVDLEQDRQASAEQAAQRQAWSPRLTRQARRREQIALVSPAAVAPENAASETRGAAPVRGASMTATARDAATVAQPAAGGLDVQSTGAWSALLQITQLLEELEPETARRASPSTATSAAPATRASRAAPASRLCRARRQREPARHGCLTRAVGGQRRTAAAVQAATGQPTDLLEQYVAMLWADTGAPAPGASAHAAARAAAEQSSAGPAPRAPSLLLPARAQREAQPGAAPPAKAADAALPPLVWPANDEQTEETVEERINRALLEQAWLRGVDLT